MHYNTAACFLLASKVDLTALEIPTPGATYQSILNILFMP